MVHLSRPRVMSMKKKMIAQKKEKGIEAMASLGTKVTANKRLKTGMKKKSKSYAFILGRPLKTA